MIKDTPSLGRMAAMIGFAFSCVAILLYLWLAFGGSVPLRPEGYRFEAKFTEAALLVKEADIRIAGLNVGKVKAKRLDAKSGATIATLEIEEKYAPLPADTKALLRIKALLGETYVELTPGDKSKGMLADGGRLPNTAIEKAVEIDEIISLFDRPTRRNFRGWIRELATAIDKGRGEDLNDAIGNLPRFVASADDVLKVLDDEEPAVRALVRNSGRTLEAVNERRGQLRQLIVNANDTFDALASRNESLAEAIVIFPTFLRESQATFGRLKTFANDTRPLVRDLQPVMTELRPTLRDVGRLAPDLENLFRDLGPLIDEAPDTLPSAARFIRGAEPVLAALSPYLREFNPILSYLNFQQEQVADFITNGGGSFSSVLPPLTANEGPRHYLRSYSASNARSAGISRTRPSYDRGNAYPSPNYFRRARPLGMFEAFDCKPNGVQREPANGEPPCFVQPKTLWDGGAYPRLGRGEAPVRKPPQGNDGSAPARP